MDEMRWFMRVNVVLFMGVAVIHILCLRMLCSINHHTHLHQRLLLINMSIYHVLFAIVSIIYIVMDMNADLFPEVINVIFYFVRPCLATLFIIVLNFITLDRFLEVYLHLRYSKYVTKHLVQKLLVSAWLSGVLIGLAFALLRHWKKNLAIEMVYYIFPALDLTFVLNAIGVYTYLYMKLCSWRNRLNRLTQRFQVNFKSPKYLIPMLIVITYFMLNVTGNVLSVANNALGASLTYEVYLTSRQTSLCLFALGAMSDAIVYIILQRGCRRVLSRRFLRWMQTTTDGGVTQTRRPVMANGDVASRCSLQDHA